MKKRSSKRKSEKKKIVFIVLAVLLIVLIVLGVTAYALTHGFYKKTNYTSDEDAMNQFTETGEDVEEIDPEKAQGEVLTPERRQSWSGKWRNFRKQSLLPMMGMYTMYC